MEEHQNHMQPTGENGADMNGMNNMHNTMQAEAPMKQGNSMGPMVGIIVIVALLGLGGLYFWGGQLNNQTQDDVDTIFNESANDDIAAPSDEPEAIEQDLDNFDGTEFDAELEADLDAIDLEL